MSQPPTTMPSLPPKIVFYDAADGRRLAARVWEPAVSPRARVIFLHGVISHGGWYSECATYLAGMGLEVHYLDRRGSGLNADEPGDMDRWQTLVDDVARYIESCRQTGRANALSPNASPEYPGGEMPCRTVLCGISWGGKLAAAVARKHPGMLAGLGLICPGIYSPYSPGLLKRLALATPVPARFQRRRLQVPLRPASLFTDSREWQDFINHDPLTLRKVTWRFASEDRHLTRYAQQAATHLYLPALLMLAGRDRIIDNCRVRGYFGRIRSTRKTLIEYSSAGHTLEFERDSTRYFNDLGEWVRQNAGCGCDQAAQSSS